MRKVINSFVVLFLSSCGGIGSQTTKEMDDPLADRFQPIERKLQEFAHKHSAKPSTVWSKIQKNDPEGYDSFLVRHIVWIDGRLGKAVFIGQHSDIKGVDTTTWDFSTIAWLADTLTAAKPTYVNHLLTKVDFQIIEKNIEQLLSTSEKTLNVVKVEDLK